MTMRNMYFFNFMISSHQSVSSNFDVSNQTEQSQSCLIAQYAPSTLRHTLTYVSFCLRSKWLTEDQSLR